MTNPDPNKVKTSEFHYVSFMSLESLDGGKKNTMSVEQYGWTHPTTLGLAFSQRIEGFSVTHTLSGRRAFSYLDTAEDAMLYMLELAVLGDWTRPYKVIVKDKILKKAIQALAEKYSEAAA